VPWEVGTGTADRRWHWRSEGCLCDGGQAAWRPPSCSGMRGGAREGQGRRGMAKLGALQGPLGQNQPRTAHGATGGVRSPVERERRER